MRTSTAQAEDSPRNDVQLNFGRSSLDRIALALQPVLRRERSWILALVGIGSTDGDEQFVLPLMQGGARELHHAREVRVQRRAIAHLGDTMQQARQREGIHLVRRDLVEPALDYLKQRSWSNATVNALLAWMTDNQATGEEGAKHFLTEQPDIWTKWVPADVAEKVKAAL